MALRRYTRTNIIGINTKYGTSRAIPTIRRSIKDGTIRYRETVLNDGQRLDSIAGKVYNDATLWWIIAAASNIGWGLQVPPGTVLRIPNLEDVSALVG